MFLQSIDFFVLYMIYCCKITKLSGNFSENLILQIKIQKQLIIIDTFKRRDEIKMYYNVIVW